MANKTFVCFWQVIAAANGQITGSYQVPTNEILHIQRVLWSATSSSFVIYDIRDGKGYHYTNASLTTPIPAIHFQQANNAGLSIFVLDQEIVIPGGTLFYIDYKDTSGASNTINWSNLGYKEIP